LLLVASTALSVFDTDVAVLDDDDDDDSFDAPRHGSTNVPSLCTIDD
jgi:hypothetical protein